MSSVGFSTKKNGDKNTFMFESENGHEFVFDFPEAESPIVKQKFESLLVALEKDEWHRCDFGNVTMIVDERLVFLHISANPSSFEIYKETSKVFLEEVLKNL